MEILFKDISENNLRPIQFCLCIQFLLGQGWSLPASSEELTVAVAANFHPVLVKLKSVYEQPKGYTMVISSGSTGHLYAQIKNGAPYDVYLAADAERPELLEKEGLGVAGSRFTYAVGRLALWGNGINETMIGPDLIRKGDFHSLAIANPELAPYGLAAKQILDRLALWDGSKDKIVMGENIGQTYSLVHTGNAELGFVSLSQVLKNNQTAYWEVPDTLHEPILQQVILLARAENNSAARYFLEFLKSEIAKDIISASGYTLE
jgi:molybdate transport system substrate-binding protein